MVLLIIIYIVKLMSKVSDKVIDPISAKNESRRARRAEKKEAKRLAAVEEREPAVASPNKKPAAPPKEDLELVAVLAAAAAAMMGTSPANIRVASYQKAGRRSAWSRAGRAEQIAGKPY